MLHRTVHLLLFAATPGLVTAPCGIAQDVMTRDQAVEDLRYFVRLLEVTHPDPYSALGGKLEFKRLAQDLYTSVPPDGLSAPDLYDRLAPFLARLGDGHTRLSIPDSKPEVDGENVLPLRFDVVTDAVYVSRAAPGYEHLIGHRLLSVDGRMIEEATEAARALFPAENEYGARRYLAGAIRMRKYAEQLLNMRLDELALGLESLEGAVIDVDIPFAEPDEWDTRVRVAQKLPGPPDDPSGPIWWRILEPSGVGYLRLQSIQGRESFEEARGRTDLPGYVSRYYSRFLDSEAPEDLDKALANIPCFTSTMADLLTELRDRRSTHLIVDVRGNDGGWSSLMRPLYLLAFGEAWADFQFPDTWVDVASEPYLEMRSWGADDLAREWGSEYEIGDFRFDKAGSPRGKRSWDEYADSLEPMMCGLADRVRSLQGRPLYPVRVVVLTDSGTFSAAFQLAYTLWRLDAPMVGTPSSQSGNAFTNVLRVELPNSGLVGSIAGSAQLFFPIGDPSGEVLMPDFPVLWRDLARFDFDRDGEMLYALELIEKGRL